MNTLQVIWLDQFFGPAIKDFEFMVPSDYNHDSQIDIFYEKAKILESTYYFNDGFTSQNFRSATTRLTPGKTYRVRIFPVLQTVTSEDCMTFLQKQGAVLVGGQGATLTQDLNADKFPVGKWTISFDEKDSLSEDINGYHGVPCVYRYPSGDWGFYLGYFEDGWGGDCYLLCFSDK